VVAALRQKKALTRIAMSDNNRFTFRVFLLKIQGSGSEFRDMRRLLLKQLDGDSGRIYAAYRINIDTVEMKRKFNAHLVGKGYLEGFDLEFRGSPSINPCTDMKVPVVIWQLPGKAQTRLDYDEFINVGDFRKEYLNVKLEAFTDQVIKDNLPRDEIKALVYIPKAPDFEPLGQLPLTTYNILFQAYLNQHHFDTAFLVRASLAATTQYEERQLAKYERQNALLKYGFTVEESEIVYRTLITRWLISDKPENSPSNL
jgi:hypothetical protein